MYRLYNLCCRVHYISMAVPRVASIHIQGFQNKQSQKKLNRLEAFAAHRTQCSGTNFYHRSGEGRKKGLERLSPDGLTLHFLTGQDRAPRLRKVILNLNMYIVYGRQWTGRMIQELCDKASYQEERTSIQLEQALVCSSASRSPHCIVRIVGSTESWGLPEDQVSLFVCLGLCISTTQHAIWLTTVLSNFFLNK